MLKSSAAVILVPIAAILLIAGGAGLAVRATPLTVVTHYPLEMLIEEAALMVECAECHTAASFHTCATCHDEHGSATLEGFPFYAGVILAGDVPSPGYVRFNEILPYRDHPYTHKPLLTYLAEQGVTDFESVTLSSNDGGFVTIARADLTAEALLLPYADGLRFAAQDLHISTWLKGITRMIVVGPGRSLTLDGQAISIGQLLLGPTVEVTVEQADVMLQSAEDDTVRRAKTASRIVGVPLANHLATPGSERLIVTDTSGTQRILEGEKAVGALLAQLRGETILVLPNHARNQWIVGVAEIRSE